MSYSDLLNPNPSNSLNFHLNTLTIGSGSISLFNQLELNKKQALLLPRLTTIERNALVPAQGQLIYNITTNEQEIYNGSSWVSYLPVAGPSYSEYGAIYNFVFPSGPTLSTSSVNFTKIGRVVNITLEQMDWVGDGNLYNYVESIESVPDEYLMTDNGTALSSIVYTNGNPQTMILSIDNVTKKIRMTPIFGDAWAGQTRLNPCTTSYIQNNG